MSHHETPIYLDANATTPLLPEVVEAMLPFLRDHFGNPSSGHVFGQRAREAVERARGQVAALIGAAPDEIVFTSGGTEANNLAIAGVANERWDHKHLVTSVIEHPAVSEPCRHLVNQGWMVTRLSVDAEGRVRGGEVAKAVDEGTALVTLMHANNETGVLQPIAEAARLAHLHGALFHTDAAQSVGKVPVDVAALDVDLLSLAGHKLYAPKGVGALYVRQGTVLQPLLRGAGHERGLRPGTENVASIAGLGVACELARETLAEEFARQRRLRDLLFQLLREAVPDVTINGHPEERLPNTLNLRFPGVRGAAVLAHAPEVAASTGAACHDGGERPSAVITAMGIAPEAALGSVRLSLGRGTTDDEVRRAAQALIRGFRSS